MIKLKTSATHKHGHKNVIPHVGEIHISEEGIIEVPDMQTAENVCNAVSDFSITEIDGKSVENTLKPKAEQNTLGKEAGSELKTNTTEDDDKKPMAEAEADAMLNSKTLGQLQQIAKDAGLPGEQWGTLQKAPLKTYLKNVLTTTV